MSKIEEAMEKAKALHDKTIKVEQGAPASEKVAHSMFQKPAEHIEISSPRMVAANDYNLPISEEYRKLRSMVIQLTSQMQHKTLMVTSSIGGEGKSVTALNLALSLAQEYDHSVLLVDCDLRNPSLCRYLGLDPRRPGLAECLLDGSELDDVLVNTDLDSLLLLPAGREVPNPVEVLSSQKMSLFIENLKQRFAGYYIVFDISPVLPFAEARIIGRKLDGIVFVVKEGGTSRRNINDAIEALKPANVLGLVYNKTTTAGLAGGYHYYYDYNYHYREPGPSETQKTGIFSRLMGRMHK